MLVGTTVSDNIRADVAFSERIFPPAMINFLKEYSYSIFKMLVNQIGMTMFGLVLSMATHQNDTLLLITSLFAVLFYMVLLYTMTWEVGYAEKIRIDNNRLKLTPLKGLYMSLVANIPNIVLAILAIVGYYGGVLENGVPVSPEWAVNLYGTAKIIALFIQGMYSGIVSLYFPATPWVLLLIVLPSLVTCTLAYLAGVKGKRFTRLLGPSESRE